MGRNVYVMSDIHGQFDMFMEMLYKIDFNYKDELYILGDIIDRGHNPIECLDYIMNKENIKCIQGNHEWFLYDFARKCNWKAPQYYYNTYTFLKLKDDEQREKYLSWMENLPLQRKIEVEGQTYYLNHALALNEKELVMYDDMWDLLVTDYEKYPAYTYWFRNDGNTYIFGHVETPRLRRMLGEGESNIIWYNANRNVIDIDCGAYLDGGCLACLRLNDMQEFYVER